MRRTRDGVPVVLHDEALDRTTSGSGPLRTRTWAEVRALDAGAWYSPQFAGERVPSLDELCRWVAPRKLDLALELKQPRRPSDAAPDRDLAPAVLSVLREHGLPDRTLLHSFHHPSLAQVRALDARAVLGLLYDSAVSDDPSAIARAYAPAGLHVHARWLSRELCAAAHAAGLHVHAWGLPEPLERDVVLDLADLGADSLSANAPDLLVAILAAAGRR